MPSKIKGVPSRREERQSDRRQFIIAVACRSFLQDGYARTTMSGIAATLGGSKSTLWRYFPSKEELFTAVLDQATSEYHKRLCLILDPSEDVATAVERFCFNFLKTVTSADALSLYRLVVGEGARFPEIGQIYHARVQSVTNKILANYFAKAMSCGSLREGNPLRLAQALRGLCISKVEDFLLSGSTEIYRDEVIDSDVNEVRDIFLRAFARN